MADSPLQQRAAQQLAGYGRSSTSCWRAQRVFSRIIHMNESAPVAHVNFQIRPPLQFSAVPVILSQRLGFVILRRKVTKNELPQA
jgi:hypothetical protein